MLFCGRCCCLPSSLFHGNPTWWWLVLNHLMLVNSCVGLLVQFRWSKTIQFGGWVLLVPGLAIANSPLCPLRAYGNMLKFIPAQDSNPGFGVNVGSRYLPLSYEMLQKFIKSSVATLGLDPGLFNYHSLCRAGASWAFSAQVLAERCQVAQRMTMEIRTKVCEMMHFHCCCRSGAETGTDRFLGEVYQGPWCQGQGLPGWDPDTAGGPDQVQSSGCQPGVTDPGARRH